MAVAEASFKISIDSMSLGLINERGLVVHRNTILVYQEEMKRATMHFQATIQTRVVSSRIQVMNVLLFVPTLEAM